MSRNEQKKVSRVKIKKKAWHKIIGSSLFGKKELGESYLDSGEHALNRRLKVNLKDLTGNIRDQNCYVAFKIIKWQGLTLEAVHIGYELMPASVKRMVKKNTNRLDDYFSLDTKDGQKVIIKTFMLTIKKVSRSVMSKLRSVLKEILIEECQKNNFDILFGNIISGKVQQAARKRLAKIYPLKEMSIRKLDLVQHPMQTQVIPNSSSAPVEVSA